MSKPKTVKPLNWDGEQPPFYWVAPFDHNCAPTGWYQWTREGLKYLGASILESGEKK